MDNNSKYQSLLLSSRTTPILIQHFCKDFDRSKLPALLQVLSSIHQALITQSEPYVKLNALLTLLAFVKLADYPSLAFAEAMALGAVEGGALVAAGGESSSIYDYFERAGYSSSTPNLQTLSYHFTKHSLILVLLTAYLRPKRLYKTRQVSQPSPGKLLEKQLFEAGLKEEEYNTICTSQGFLAVRKEFVKGLVSLQRHPDNFVGPIIKVIEKYLVSGVRTKVLEVALGLLRSHEAFLCSEAVPRLAEIFCYHNNFRVRRDALAIITEVLLSGDLETVVILNFTEYFKIVALKVADAALHARFNKLVIFPQVAGQTEEKRLFLNDFLLAVQRTAKLFPSLEAYFLNSGHSPLYQIYCKLAECGARFPKEDEEVLVRASANFRTNKEYNLMFLVELQRQRVEWLVVDPLHPSFRHLLAFVDRNSQHLLTIRQAGTLNPNDTPWLQLMDFKKHFQDMLQRMTDDVLPEELDSLIFRGLTLKNNISGIQQLLNRAERGEISREEVAAGLAREAEDEGIKKRAETLAAQLRRREKESIGVVLSEEESVVKSKVNLRIQELAGKKSESCEVVSQLQIYSRSFIAHKLHSQQIMDQFLPILYFHPLRKLKRSTNGIRITSQEKGPVPVSPQQRSKRDSTPRFRSVVGQDGRKGLRVLQREGVKYEKYLEVLSRRQHIRFLTSDALIVLDRPHIKIERSEIKASNLPDRQILEVVFSCSCPDGIDQLKYSLTEEPSIELKCKRKQLSPIMLQLEVKGLWIKFGYALPSITFWMRGQGVEVPLPFSFNHYLTIAGSLRERKRTATATQWHRLDKKEFPYIQTMRKYLQGMRIEGNKLSGWIRFFNWECNLRILLDPPESFQVEVQSTTDCTDDLLFNFLPLFLVRLFSAPH